MAMIKGLWQDGRSGIFYIRRKVPEALRPAFNCGEFYKVSLGTADRREAEKKFSIANGEYETKLATFREALKRDGGGALSQSEATALVERYLTRRSAGGFASGGTDVSFILRDLDEAVADEAGERVPTAQSMSSAEWADYRKRIAGSDEDDEFSPETIARIQADHDARHRPPGAAWFAFQARTARRRWRPLLGDAVAAMKRHVGLAEGNLPGIDDPLADALAVALSSPEVRQQLPRVQSLRRRTNDSRAQPEMTLTALREKWEKARTPSPKAVAAATKAVADFTSFIGDIGIGEITADDCFNFRDAVETMPVSMPRAHRALAFADQYALYGGRSDLPRIQPPSVKKYLGAIQALLGYAFQERFIPANVAAGIKVEGYTKRSDRRPFTIDELKALFAAPLFTQPWSKSHSRSSVSDTTLRWLFLLGLWSGGRIEELGQVLLADIKQENGVWFIDVDDYVAPGLAETKRVKTDSSVRLIPLHPMLIALGFLERVGALRAEGAVKLFPDLKANALLVQTQEASRRANRIINQVVSKDRRLVYYSLRHTFKDLCRGAEIPVDVHDQLTGHAPVNQGGRYGFGRAVEKLAQHLSKITLDEIDWDAVKAAAAA